MIRDFSTVVINNRQYIVKPKRGQLRGPRITLNIVRKVEANGLIPVYYEVEVVQR